MVDASKLRNALRGYRQPPDVQDIELPVPARALPVGWVRRHLSNMRVAAILVPFVQTESGLEVLLTQRAAHLSHHPGQISFPGGAQEPQDAGLAATALRDAHEEVGIAPADVEVLGFLRPQWTVSGFSMTPVIGLIEQPSPLLIDEAEVAEAFQVPAQHLYDAREHRESLRQFQGLELPVVEIEWRSRRIWGATATVIQRLNKVIKNN